MNQHPTDRKKWLLRAAKLLLVAVVLWFIRRTLFDAWSQYQAWRETDQQSLALGWDWLAVAALTYVVGLLPAGIFWHRILRSLGQEAGLGETLRAYYIGHLGKYVPGKAMVVVLRAGLIRSHRVDTVVAAVSVFLETFTWLAVGGFLAAAYLVLQFRGQGTHLWGAIAVMVVLGLPTFPPLFVRLVRLAQARKLNAETGEKLQRLGYRTLLLGWALGALVWVLLGISYWAVLKAMNLEGLDFVGDVPRCTASIALATLAGFVVLILPGGLGVREAALAELMLPYLQGIGLADRAALLALVSAALLRLVWLISELAVSGVLYAIGPRKAI